MKKILLLLLVLMGATGAWAVTYSQGAQVTSAAGLTDGGIYCVRVTGGSYITDATTQYTAPNTQNSLTAEATFIFLKNGSTWKMQNVSTGNYWGTLTGKGTSGTFTPTSEASAGSFTLTFSGSNVKASSGGYYINRSSGVMHGWNSGINLQIYKVEAVVEDLMLTFSRADGGSGTATNSTSDGVSAKGSRSACGKARAIWSASKSYTA